jgi:DNA-binding transcriptional ArsR family regulator
MLSRSLSNHLRQEPVTLLNDTQLVESMQDGNERAFYELKSQFQDILVALVYIAGKPFLISQ